MNKIILSVAALSLMACAHNPASLYSKYAETVVSVQTPTGSGSGVFIDPHGTILTCYHVVAGSTSTLFYMTYPDYGIHPAEFIRGNPEMDLALIKPKQFHGKVKYVYPKYVQSHVGQRVYSIGHPIDFYWSLAEGIISGHLRNYAKIQRLQSTVITLPGSSGSPLFNEKGELVGIVQRLATAVPLPTFTGISLAIPLETIMKFLEPTPRYKLGDVK